MGTGKFKKLEILLEVVNFVADDSVRPRVVREKKTDPISLVVASDTKESAEEIGQALVKRSIGFNKKIVKLISVEETQKRLAVDHFRQELLQNAAKIIKAQGKKVRLLYVGKKIIAFCVVD